jgi:hypothetical protein
MPRRIFFDKVTNHDTVKVALSVIAQVGERA